MTRKRRRAPYKSGYCTYAPHQRPCKGEFENGSAVTPRTVLCSCGCHGDYETRMTAAGYRIAEPEPEPEEEDDE